MREGSGQTLSAVMQAFDPGADFISFRINGSHVGSGGNSPGSTRTIGATVGPFAGPRGTTVALSGQAFDSDGAGSNVITNSVQIVGPEYTSNPAPGSTMDFGEVDLGQSSTMTLEIGNLTPDGDLGNLTDLTLLDATITGPDADAFDLLNFTPGMVLSAGDLFDLLIQFNPDMLGELNATLTILTDQGAAFGQPGQSFQYQLTGVGTPEPASILVWSLLFASLLVGWVRMQQRRRAHATA